MPLKKEFSFGIIPLRQVKHHWEVLFLKHRKGHWAFPKGHPEKGETPEQTAMRELKEEAGLDVKRLVSTPPLEEHYFFRAKGQLIEKRVVYFVAEVEGDVKVQQDEISDYCWVPLKEAEDMATFPATKSLCRFLLDLKM